MKIAYVTGATGCLGRNLIELLLQSGEWTVYISHRKTSNVDRLHGLKVNLIEANLHNKLSILEKWPKHVDCVFHIAANLSHWPPDQDEQFKDNVIATKNLVEVALEKKVNHFVFTSTGATNRYTGLTEAECHKIENQYVRTKKLSELEVEKGIQKGLSAVITQPAIVVGPYDYNGYSKIFKTISEDQLTGALPGEIEFCHAREVARAHIVAFKRGRIGEKYVMGGPKHTWLEFTQKVAHAVGGRPPKRATPYWLLLIISHFMQAWSYLVNKKPILTPQILKLLKNSRGPTAERARITERDLGYRKIDLDTQIADCANWMRAEGLIKRGGQK